MATSFALLSPFMYRRLWLCFCLLLLGWILTGCRPVVDSQGDEQKNEFFKVGKSRTSAGDYKGAIEAYEKALESDSRLVRAHFELGVLYEQHSDQKENDYICAMYHYLQAINLRPNEYPADLARQRISVCKQELVKAEMLAPVEQALLRERDRLKEENQNLRKQLESALTAPAPASKSRTPSPVTASNRVSFLPPEAARLFPQTNRIIQNSAGVIGERVTPLPPPVSPVKTHTVKQNETLYSIAKQYRVSLNNLTAANPAVNPKKLKQGQVLNIPNP